VLILLLHLHSVSETGYKNRNKYYKVYIKVL
jgi:hypothetical protein